MASRSLEDKEPAPAASLTLRAAGPLPPARPVRQEVLLLDQLDQFDHARRNGVNLRRTSISRTPTNTRTIHQVADRWCAAVARSSSRLTAVTIGGNVFDG